MNMVATLYINDYFSFVGNKPELYIADSESSAIRTLLLSSGQVLTVAGGDRNPNVSNLY